LTFLKASGVIGFGPTAVDKDTYGAPLFMNTMFKAGAISKNIFSVYITDYFTQGESGSRFVIGGYLLDKYAKKGETKIAWNTIVNPNYWSVHMTGCSLKYEKGSNLAIT